ncbi:MAG TPA: peptidase, partial [Chthonomonadales bacterium]|nr:peptidase [Chthonomonadales bacterium]
MRRDRDRDRRDDYDDLRDGIDDASGGESQPGLDTPEMRLRALWLLDEVIRMTPRNDVRLGYLVALREQLETDEAMMEEARKAIAEFEEAYTKLTSPANRIGVFLGPAEPPEKKTRARRRQPAQQGQAPSLEDAVRIALGDQEYIANVDPKLENPEFRVGTQVKVNDAYTVIGDLGYASGGAIVRISEVLEDGRLRVAMDSQGMQSRVVYRGDPLKDEVLKSGAEVRMEPNFKVALEHFASKEATDYYLEEVPHLPWSMVGGQEEAITVIKDAIEL